MFIVVDGLRRVISGVNAINISLDGVRNCPRRMITIDHLRRFTVQRNFSKPTSLKLALQKMQFVQADPIKAPARAQDLILRHRVNSYRAGDLDRLYPMLDV